MSQPKKHWETKVNQLQQRLEELAIAKEILQLKVQKAYHTLDQIKIQDSSNK